jgi:hypothetical protein
MEQQVSYIKKLVEIVTFKNKKIVLGVFQCCPVLPCAALCCPVLPCAALCKFHTELFEKHFALRHARGLSFKTFYGRNCCGLTSNIEAILFATDIHFRRQDIQHNDIQHNDPQHKEIQHIGLICDTA